MSINEALHRSSQALPLPGGLLGNVDPLERIATPADLLAGHSLDEAPVSPAPVAVAEAAHEELELFPLCVITNEVAVDPAELDIPPELTPRAITRVEMHDPQLARFAPEDIDCVTTWVGAVCQYVRRRKELGQYIRLPGVAGGTYMDANGQYKNGRDKRYWGDQRTREQIVQDVGPGAKAWLDTIPTGQSLAVVENIGHVKEVRSDKGVLLGEMDDLGRLAIAAAPHGRAIRNRFSDEAWSFVELARRNGGTLEGKRIASYGSGSAPGPLKGTQVIRHQNPAARDPELLLYDISPYAIKAAQENAATLGFRGKIRHHVRNLLNPMTMAMERIKGVVSGKRPNISEAEGFYEYVSRDELKAIFTFGSLRDALRSPQTFLKAAKRGIQGLMIGKDPDVRFLKMMYKSTKEIVMISQAITGGPYEEFLDAIGWGHIRTASIRENLKKMRKAKIPLKQVEVRLPEDGIFARYIIDKTIDAGHRGGLVRRGRHLLGKLLHHGQVLSEPDTASIS